MKKVIRNSILIIIIIGIAVLYSFGTWGKNIYILNASSGDNRLTNELTGNIEIAQSFTCPYNGLNGVKVKLLRVGSDEVNGYTWSLANKQGEIIAKGKIGEQELADKTFTRKKFLTFEIPEQKDSKGEEYTFILTGTDVVKEGCLQAYITEGNELADALTIDGNHSEDAMVLKMNTKRFNVETFFVFLGLVIYIGIFFKLMNKLFK